MIAFRLLMTSLRHNIAAWILALAAGIPLASCFTGVESTPKISENDLRRAHVTDRPELAYLDSVRAEPFTSWRPGKEFVCTDPRVMRIFGASASEMKSLAGETVRYTGAREVTSITGQPVAELLFSTPYGQVCYRTDISLDSLSRRAGFDIPFMSETSRVRTLAEKIVGKTYYVTTSLWLDSLGKHIPGVKYVPVEVLDALPGSGVYPVSLRLCFTLPEPVSGTADTYTPGEKIIFYLPLTLDNNPGATRTFADQFSLSDPRKRYPRISEENWQRIIRGSVARGMTRDECRLALGSPAKLERVPGHDLLYERWTYENGVTLTFSDGILTGYRN